MQIETVTGSLLGSVLASSVAHNLFKLIANRRIAEKNTLLKTDDPDSSQAALDALESADLINSAGDGQKYYVTAKGLKVARDLEKILW